MEDLGLGYEDLRAAREDLVFVSTSGYGYGGPYSEIRSYGMMSEVMSGITSLNGYAGEEPQRGTIPLTDHPATYHIAFLIVAALERRDRTGKGAWVDVSQYEVGVNLIGDAHLARGFGASVPGPRGNGDDGHPIAGCYPCDDGSRWLVVDVCDRASWDGLREFIDFEALDFDRDPLGAAAFRRRAGAGPRGDRGVGAPPRRRRSGLRAAGSGCSGRSRGQRA